MPAGEHSAAFESIALASASAGLQSFALASRWDTAPLKQVQNTAAVLLQLRRPQLAFGYAITAVQMCPQANKARMQAASAAVQMECHQAAAYYLAEVQPNRPNALTFAHVYSCNADCCFTACVSRVVHQQLDIPRCAQQDGTFATLAL